MSRINRKPATRKVSKVQLRLRPDQKAVLAQAAQTCQTTLSNFLLEHGYEAAQRVLADQTEVRLPAAEWDAFCRALDAPPRSIPALKRLLTEASVFDGRRTPSSQ